MRRWNDSISQVISNRCRLALLEKVLKIDTCYQHRDKRRDFGKKPWADKAMRVSSVSSPSVMWILLGGVSLVIAEGRRGVSFTRLAARM